MIKLKLPPFLRACNRSALLLFLSALIFVPQQDARAKDTAVRAVLNREYLPAVLEMIRGAKKSVHVIQYEWIRFGAVVDIERELIKAEKRGVKVSILLDDSVSATKKMIGLLTRDGFDVKLDETAEFREPGDKTTHAKAILVDGEKLILGSTNFSDKAIGENNEANIYMESGEAGKAFLSYFDQLRKNAEREPVAGPCHMDGVDVIFNRQYLPTVHPLFRNAKKRIFVALYGINIGPPHSAARELIDDLKQAHDRGVDVRVMIDRSTGEFSDKTMEINVEAREYFDKLGIPVKFDSTDVITHAKILVADDAAVVGGTNWGHGPLELYNDCNAVVRRPDVVKKLSGAFLNIWNGAKQF